LTIVTLRFQILYCFVIVDLARREILHIGVTSSPSAQYAGQCFVEAVADRDNENPRFLIRDRDSIYGEEFRRRVKNCGTRCLITPPPSPKANAICERLNETLRHDCLDHMIVRDALHGQRVLDEYVRYYHGSNQKVLATAAALLRLGSTWRFRTELSGPPPDGDGTIVGDLVLRGSGDPSLRDAHLDAMAEDLARRGAVRVEGRVLGDPRRIGSDEAFVAGRSPVRVGWSALAHSPGQQELGQRMGRASLGGSRRRNLWRQRQYRQGCARLAGCAD